MYAVSRDHLILYPSHFILYYCSIAFVVNTCTYAYLLIPYTILHAILTCNFLCHAQIVSVHGWTRNKKLIINCQHEQQSKEDVVRTICDFPWDFVSLIHFFSRDSSIVILSKVRSFLLTHVTSFWVKSKE